MRNLKARALFVSLSLMGHPLGLQQTTPLRPINTPDESDPKSGWGKKKRERYQELLELGATEEEAFEAVEFNKGRSNLKKYYSRDAEYPSDCCRSCPFTYSDSSETAQNYGCLPDHNTIVKRYLRNEGFWQCHSRKGVPCGGLASTIKQSDLPTDRNTELLVDGDNE